MTKQVSILIAGAGGRGWEYSQYAALYPSLLKITGVAEPRPYYRNRMTAGFGIPPERVFDDWRQMACQPKMADAVIIALQDVMHKEAALAFAEKGYDILLEKPMATNRDDCDAICQAVKKNGIIFAVCHVLRYNRYTQEKIKEVIASGRIGEVVCIQSLEPVGYWHHAHSYVRGNWRKEAESSFMLLTKSCHDLDWIRHIIGVPCRKITSFGSLFHFRKENKPQGASDRCMDCRREPDCAYSAKKIYLGRLRNGENEWPVNIFTPDVTPESVSHALTTGPYGECVYKGGNDVVDNQVVNMEFEGGKTASFLMTAFTETGDRRTVICGTKGEISGNGETIRIFGFQTDRTEIIKIPNKQGKPLESHGGGDFGLMRAFVQAVADQDSGLLATPEETLESHSMVFAAEEARRENRIITL